MTNLNSDAVTGAITLTVVSQSNGQYSCQLSSSLADRPNEDIHCHGQTPDHAIAIALEKLADDIITPNTPVAIFYRDPDSEAIAGMTSWAKSRVEASAS